MLGIPGLINVIITTYIWLCVSRTSMKGTDVNKEAGVTRHFTHLDSVSSS